MTAKKKSLWANSINLAGLYSKKPTQVFYNEDLEEYYDRGGNYSISGPGMITSESGGVISFASESKEEVEIWTLGAKTAMTMMAEWCRWGKLSKNETTTKKPYFRSRLLADEEESEQEEGES